MFLNVKKYRDINFHTFLISDSPINYAFLAVPFLYLSFAIHGQQLEIIISQGFLMVHVWQSGV